MGWLRPGAVAASSHHVGDLIAPTHVSGRSTIRRRRHGDAGDVAADMLFKRRPPGDEAEAETVSIMAKRPLASWVEPTSLPLTYVTGLGRL